MDALQELVQHNLVRATATSDDIIRYTMLETIREYALQSLREAGEDVILRQRHGIYFLDLAEHADAAVENPLKVRWLYILEREHDNIREAERHFTNIKSAALCQRLGSALIWFWNLHNHLIEGRHFLDRALSLPGPAPIHCTAKILQERGHYAMYEGQFDVALEYLQRCDELLKHADVWPERALSLRSLGVLAHRRGDFATAETIYSEALALCVMRGAEQEKGRFFGQLGILALDQGNIVLAQRKLRESLLILREGGDQHLIAMCLENFGNAMMYGGDYLAADAAFQEGLRLHRENDYPWGAAECLDSLGRLAWYRGNYPEAHRYLTESLLLRREPPTYIWEVVESVESFAALAASELQPRRAARLWGAAETLNKAVHKPYSLAGHADFARARSSARALLDEETWHAEWEVGRNLSLQTVIALALDTQHQNTVGSDPTHDAAEMTHHALTAE